MICILFYYIKTVKKKSKMKIPDISVVSSSDIMGSESCNEEDFIEIADDTVVTS